MLNLNKIIIFDYDDAIYLRSQVTDRVNRTMSLSSLVISGNEYLKDYANQYNNNVVVIPTVVDTDFYKPPIPPRHPNEYRVIIGWIGSDPNRGDFNNMKPVFEWLWRNYQGRVTFRVIGRHPLKMDTAMKFEFVPWELDLYLSELQMFDIGIMPLEDNPWNRGKCGLKLIQYMAVGTAPISSPVGANKDIIEHGKSGYLAKDTYEWMKFLSLLIENESERKRIGRNARSRVESSYSIKAVFSKFVQTIGLST
jgi:glycosyltransferase involved in cell wall biosynthesis